MNKEQMENYLWKPASVGLVGSVAMRLAFDEPGLKAIEVMGKAVPAWAYWFGLFYGGSVLSSLGHEYIFPIIPHDAKLDKPVSALVAGGISASTAYLGSNLANKNLVDLEGQKVLLAGLGSEVVGDYVYHNFVKPMWN